jgi:hypothetical protein
MSMSLVSTEGCYSKPVPKGNRRLGWDGVSFCVPSNWELADYRYQKRRACRIEIEDEVAIRIESEWVRTTDRFNLESIMKRYTKASQPLTMKAEVKTELQNLPNGWSATRFTFKETGHVKSTKLQLVCHELVTVFYICPQSSLFCFFLLHFLPEDKEDPLEIVNNLTRTFQDHKDQLYSPWELFDIKYRIPKEFLLKKSSFDIGSKMMVFEWEKRRLFTWTYSCVDIFLKDWNSTEHWVVGSLNAARILKGIVFRLDENGKVSWRRNKMHPIGVRDEIWRWCFRYEVGCKVLTKQNQLFVYVYQYRKPDDLHRISSIT